MCVRVNVVAGEVVVAVGLQPVQVIPVVDHHPTGVVHSSPGGIRHPVDSPEAGAVTKVEIGYRVESKVSPLLLIEISSTQSHEDWPQHRYKGIVFTPFATFQCRDDALVDSLSLSPREHSSKVTQLLVE